MMQSIGGNEQAQTFSKTLLILKERKRFSFPSFPVKIQQMRKNEMF